MIQGGNNSGHVMKTKSGNTAGSLSNKARTRAVPKAAEQTAAFIDPATQHLVVRDLRFHHFVAHQREVYFQNWTR